MIYQLADLFQNLPVSDGECWTDRAAGAGGIVHTLCSHRCLLWHPDRGRHHSFKK